jgi:hypothetical protein
MDAPQGFVPGLALGRMFYDEVAREVVENVVQPGSYAAGFMGKGSDVLGYDSPTSADHDWGPRFLVFLADGASPALAARLDAELKRALPKTFHGHPVSFPDPDPLESGVDSAEGFDSDAVHHLVQITTLHEWLVRFLGMDPRGGMGSLDWLTFPEQRLVEVTSGEVFHDPRGELTAVRGMLAYHPRDVWLYRMACQWQRISQEEAFVGRCAESVDLLGMRLLAARVSRDVMKLGFLMERRYAPYDKWLGTAFGRLACGSSMMPRLLAVLDARDYPTLEKSLVEVYRALAGMHNGLGVTGALDTTPRSYLSRPYLVLRADRFANALLHAIRDTTLTRIPVRMGAIDQFIDCTDYIENVGMYRKTLSLYR